MDAEKYEKYSNKRSELLKEYKLKKLKNCGLVVLVAVLALVLTVLLAVLIDNVAVGLVIGMMIVIFAVIMLRVRVVTVNHILQSRLQYLEQEYE